MCLISTQFAQISVKFDVFFPCSQLDLSIVLDMFVQDISRMMNPPNVGVTLTCLTSEVLFKIALTMILNQSPKTLNPKKALTTPLPMTLTSFLAFALGKN